MASGPLLKGGAGRGAIGITFHDMPQQRCIRPRISNLLQRTASWNKIRVAVKGAIGMQWGSPVLQWHLKN